MKTTMEEIIEQKTKKIIEKGSDMSNLDLYNLCVLNRLSETEEEKGSRTGLNE